ncbi:MepB family protein [Agreia sp.]|uniref:MepB family protein n=1 Tax=Agreia sp. TaxID=1872416 RepID=UPI0035BBA593
MSTDAFQPRQFRAFEAYAIDMGLAAAVTPEAQTSDYESGVAQIGEETWHIRTARNTPTKPGAFVAFWRREADGTTAPFRDDDPAAGLLVFVAQQGRRGVFRFTGAQLAELGIASGRKPGKRGFRVYPSWCAHLNAQAMSTQRAQAAAFHEV